jgi:isocitrate lyase
MNEVQGREFGQTYPGLESRDYAASDRMINPEDGYARFKFSGAYLADALFETAIMGVDGVKKGLAMGEGVVKGPKANRLG